MYIIMKHNIKIKKMNKMKNLYNKHFKRKK